MLHKSQCRYSQDCRRSGMTVIELLTVVAVIGILVALLVPAVQQAREAARRTQCVSNLRQIGIAIHSYLDSYAVFPPGLGSSSRSAHVSMLPYLEQRDLYGKFDWAKLAMDEFNVNVARRHQVPVFACPSDPLQPYGGTTNYVGNCGTGLHVAGRFEGLFAPIVWIDNRMGGGVVAIRDVTDGTSNTAAFSEILIGGGSSAPLRSLWDLSVGFGSPVDASRLTRACDELDTNAERYFGGWMRGFPWTDGNPPATMYNHSNVPNRKSCTNNGDVITSVYTAGSLHLGGANVCWGDASVRFVHNSIDGSVWQALGTKSGGEVTHDF